MLRRRLLPPLPRKNATVTVIWVYRERRARELLPARADRRDPKRDWLQVWLWLWLGALAEDPQAVCRRCLLAGGYQVWQTVELLLLELGLDLELAEKVGCGGKGIGCVSSASRMNKCLLWLAKEALV